MILDLPKSIMSLALMMYPLNSTESINSFTVILPHVILLSEIGVICNDMYAMKYYLVETTIEELEFRCALSGFNHNQMRGVLHGVIDEIMTVIGSYRVGSSKDVDQGEVYIGVTIRS